MRGESGLGELVEDYLSRPLRLHVYNHEYGVVREVTVTPSRNWGGEGALGCTLGYGALHRIPPPLEEPPQGPGETLFEGNGEDSGYEGGRDESRYALPMNNANSTTLNLNMPGPHNPGGNPYNLTSPSLLVPAALDNPPPLISTTSPPPPPGSSSGPGHGVGSTPIRSARKARNASPNKGLAFDEYWKESEEKSRDLDYALSSGSGSKPVPAPPPPKSNKGAMSVETRLPVPPHSGGEPRQTRSPDPILDDDEEEEEGEEEEQEGAGEVDGKEQTEVETGGNVEVGEGDQEWMNG